MIAFFQPPESPRRSPALQRVHRLLAATLLRSSDLPQATPIAGWKAWLLVAWLTMVAWWSVVRVIGCLF
jgi:hypothetical protein